MLHLHDIGADVLAGGKVIHPAGFEHGHFVQATIAIPPSADLDLWKKELFAPILNVAVFDDLEEAIERNNAVPQGLSSSIWTRDIRNIGKFLGPAGSDCGIVNVCQVSTCLTSLTLLLCHNRSMWALVVRRLVQHLEGISGLAGVESQGEIVGSSMFDGVLAR
jgi:hypothetical protein